MMNARSSNNKKEEETMATVTKEMKFYFEKLIEPLVTNKLLEELLKKLKDDFLEKFNEKLYKQNAKVEKVTSIISVHENKTDKLLIVQ